MYISYHFILIYIIIITLFIDIFYFIIIIIITELNHGLEQTNYDREEKTMMINQNRSQSKIGAINKKGETNNGIIGFLN